MGITKTQIEKWNSYFKTLSKAEQRVAIAKDVVKQIKVKKYVARSGSYIQPKVNFQGDVRSQFDKIVDCECCALGSCLLSAVKFKNTLEYDDLFSYFERDSKFTKMLNSIFSTKQQALIEASFEGGDYLQVLETTKFRLTEEEIDKCVDFYYNFKDSKKRLIAIMENIISNKGTFKP